MWIPCRAKSTAISRCNLCRDLVEEALDHHLGCRVDQALAHGGDGSAHLDIALVGNSGSLILGSEGQDTLTLHESDFAGAFDGQLETIGRRLFGDADFPI